MPYGKNLLDQVRHISDERNPIEYTGLRVGCTSPDLRVSLRAGGRKPETGVHNNLDDTKHASVEL